MSERFRVDIGCIIDEENGLLNIIQIKDKLNEMDAENKRLHKRLYDKEDLLKKQLVVSQNLDKKLKEYESTLDIFIENEKTVIGKNILKQYKNAIL